MLKIIQKIHSWLKKVKFILEGHPFLTFANFVSLFLGLASFILILMIVGIPKESKLSDYIFPYSFLVPIFFVYFVSLLSYFIYKKIKWISRVFSFVLQSFIIIFIQIIYGFLIILLLCAFVDVGSYQKLENYEKALKQFNKQVVEHFPPSVPTSASNINYTATTASFHGGQDICIKFDIDKEYIKNELNKHSYVKIVKYNDYEARKDYRFYCNGIDLKDYVFYIIGDRDHQKIFDTHRLYHYGIGVNIDKNQILYYYENPD